MPGEVWTCSVCRAAFTASMEHADDEADVLCPECRRARTGGDRGTSPAYRISKFMLERPRTKASATRRRTPPSLR
jgi:hypothetical protein